jgi:hypothetical protein
MSCIHRPILSRISISKNIYTYVYRNEKYYGLIRVVFFKHYHEEKPELIYTETEYFEQNTINEDEILTLFNENYELNHEAQKFCNEIVKMCGQCFFEYIKKYNIDVLIKHKEL